MSRLLRRARIGRLDQLGDVDALTNAYSPAFVGAAVVAVVGAVLAAISLRMPARTGDEQPTARASTAA
ncbi:hypothetical protein ACIBL3_12210 [Kribbella sp. NPDC050124]|uniref:hypothetical protein n=1 Tax=Kribbella sp. NPDC050124 TaxID=3364114 RepID=UPI0037B52ECD